MGIEILHVCRMDGCGGEQRICSESSTDLVLQVYKCIYFSEEYVIKHPACVIHTEKRSRFKS